MTYLSQSSRWQSHHPQGIKGDRLGYRTYAETIVNIFAGLKAHNTGLTIGVFGDWGIGKSSVLRMVKEELEEQNRRWKLSSQFWKIFQMAFERQFKGKLIDQKLSCRLLIPLRRVWERIKVWDRQSPRDRYQASRRRYIIVEFDTWRYIKQEDLWLALLRKILTEIGNRTSLWHRFILSLQLWNVRRRTNPLARINWWRILFRLMWIAAVIWLTFFVAATLLSQNSIVLTLAELLGYTGLASVVFGPIIYWPSKFLIDLLGGRINIALPPLTRPGFDQGQPILMDSFREEFRTVIEAISKNTTVIVLVDDLDRCPLEQVVPMLEAMKHFGFDDLAEARSNQSLLLRCVSRLQHWISRFLKSDDANVAIIAFVLAADRRAIEHAVAGYYKDYWGQMTSLEAERFAREYVEKIVQIPFDLPPLTRTKLEELLATKEL